MANISPMGPPPSPKEPRRSGRRSLPSTSSSKSPAGSPTSDSTPPKSKDNSNGNSRPALSSNGGSGRSKKAKHEDPDEGLDELPKPATNGRNKRKGKDKEKGPLAIDIPDDALSSILDPIDGNADPNAQDEDEAGVTRCICDGTGDDETMVECDMCHEWQHCQCMGLTPDTIPDEYFCERCRPDLYPDLAKKHAKRARQSSSHLHSMTAAASRSSRSRSPSHLSKPPKRRNTMNSRDAAYDESLQLVIEASAAEARAATMSPIASAHREDVKATGNNDPEYEPENEPAANGRRKRKRSDDDAAFNKRTRSASIVSDRAATVQQAARAETPATKEPTTRPLPSSTAAAAPKTAARAKRGGGRRAQTKQDEQMALEGDDPPAAGGASTRRQTSGRSRGAGHDGGSRRGQAGTAGGHHHHHHGAHSYGTGAAGSRAYHSSHAYAVSQQPLLTSWALPDYLAHLAHILPTDVPKPLEVRGFSVGSAGGSAGQSSGLGLGGLEVSMTTERGVKVKWPSKRMSVGDMNKRVRAMVEWVGREQASAAERTRRKEALEAALQEIQLEQRSSNHQNANKAASTSNNANGSATAVEGGTLTESPDQEKSLRAPSAVDALRVSDTSATMKMMEELMEELIDFQERFGPGAKVKERERRAAAAS